MPMLEGSRFRDFCGWSTIDELFFEGLIEGFKSRSFNFDFLYLLVFIGPIFSLHTKS